MSILYYIKSIKTGCLINSGLSKGKELLWELQIRICTNLRQICRWNPDLRQIFRWNPDLSQIFRWNPNLRQILGGILIWGKFLGGILAGTIQLVGPFVALLVNKSVFAKIVSLISPSSENCMFMTLYNATLTLFGKKVNSTLKRFGTRIVCIVGTAVAGFGKFTLLLHHFLPLLWSNGKLFRWQVL